jgi:hypothetical protein
MYSFFVYVFIDEVFFLTLSIAHAWVREGGDASDIPLDISVLSNMRQFVKYSRFKQFALKVSLPLTLILPLLRFIFSP